jgi:twitching motility protein PilJ
MAKKTKPNPGKANRMVVLLGVLLLISIGLALASFLHNERWKKFNERFLLETIEQQTLVPQISNDALDAAQGDEAAFEHLRKRTNAFERGLAVLKDGNPDAGLPVSPPEVGEQLRDVESAWLAMREAVDELLSSQDEINSVRALAEATRALLPELGDATMEAAELMVKKEAPPAAVLVVAQQAALLERMGSTFGSLLRGGTASVEAIDSGTAAAEEFALNLDDLLQGNPARGLAPVEDSQVRGVLENVGLLYKTMRAGANELFDLMPQVTPSLNNVERVVPAATRLDNSLNELVQAYREIPGRMRIGPITVGPTTALLFAAFAALFLVLLGIQLLLDARRREAESKAQNEANQQSILRLLDEMGDLADGDLTVEATVTEDITGAIADSINYAVDALRNLVTTINETAEKVTSSAQGTRKTTLALAEASDVQTQQISSATEAIKAMTSAIDEVANNATESAEVASRSVEVAGRGAQTVRDTISGMDAIREQIQETSKRIKRLGESSQEIGEIVELIDDIADQTNILALNAAMQAAQAGEAGRGFAVVADEVQGLAERSSNATKQIEALVRTIQADTNEAVSSMEASTAGVVEGATLAENAGDALREIENVSNYIADLTRRIADSAQSQSQEAGKISATVTGIQEITKRNAEGTRHTAESVKTLADLAVELQQSVSGFRLP